MRVAVLVLVAVLPAGLAAAPHDHRDPGEPQVLAPGYSALQFAAPVAGSYTLPALGAAADGAVLRSNGETTSLHELYGDKLVVLSFIFTSCSDVNGCPLAGFVLAQLQRRAMQDARLADGVRLISLSFDPENDTPRVMADYGGGFRREGFDWQFLTCASEDALAPILRDYDQWVLKDYDADGRYLGSISHLLRVYLIDRNKRIRNIYSPSFLHPDILLADIRTLLMDENETDP